MTWRTTLAAASPAATEVVELVVPADPAYLTVLRTATAGFATRLELTLDEIDDLRIAVDEASALLLGHRCHPDRTVTATFDAGPAGLDVHLSGPVHPAAAREEPEHSAWAVLNALVGTVSTGTDDDGNGWIALTHRRTEAM